MLLPKMPALAAPEDASTAEARMRRSLGLDGAGPTRPVQRRPEQARTRHRFIRDGEVPVEIVTSQQVPDAALNRHVATLRTALDRERGARAAAERSLAEAQVTIRSLQAKLAHAELAHSEALAAERRTREQAEAVLRNTTAARELIGRKPNEAAPTHAVEKPAPRATAKRAGSGKSTSRAPAAKTREPQPVRWWLPSYKAKTKAR